MGGKFTYKYFNNFYYVFNLYMCITSNKLILPVYNRVHNVNDTKKFSRRRYLSPSIYESFLNGICCREGFLSLIKLSMVNNIIDTYRQFSLIAGYKYKKCVNRDSPLRRQCGSYNYLQLSLHYTQRRFRCGIVWKYHTILSNS